MYCYGKQLIKASVFLTTVNISYPRFLRLLCPQLRSNCTATVFQLRSNCTATAPQLRNNCTATAEQLCSIEFFFQLKKCCNTIFVDMAAARYSSDVLQMFYGSITGGKHKPTSTITTRCAGLVCEKWMYVPEDNK